MNIAKSIFLSSALLTSFATSVHATTPAPVPSPSITIIGPSSGTVLVSPFKIHFAATTCLNQPVSALGYSLDNGGDTILNGTDLVAVVESGTGLHTLHAKAWGNMGAECLTDLGIAVTPSTALNVGGIDKLENWAWRERNAPAVKGTSAGSSSLINLGNTREYRTTYTNSGSELYYASFSNYDLATNFLYDTWVAVASPNTGIANLEMDLNEVTANGLTIIFGFQCDGYSGTWDYSTNSGTPAKPVDTWIHSDIACNVRNWSTNVWHHVQISYSRDGSGNVTFQGVALDGVVSDINATVPSAYALGWAQTLLTNFEVDGLGASGSSTVYMNDLSVYRW